MEVKNYPCFRIILFLVGLVSGSVFGQGINYKIQSGAYFSTYGETPFGLRANQYGTVPYQSQFFTIQGSATKEYNSFNSKTLDSVVYKKRKIDFGYGLQLIANIGKVNQVLLPEAYFKIRYKFFEVYAGRRKEIFGIVDSTFSSGSYIWSGNALPMPKIQIATSGYVGIGKNKLISINTGYAHGWFDNHTALKNSYLHQKWFYLKIGKPDWKVNVYGGFNHQVQWGGSIDLPYKLPTVVDNKLPSSFSDYIYMVSGITLNTAERQRNLNTSQYSSYDLTNRIGNHIGTIDIGVEFKIQNKYTLTLYKQSVYDDGSLFFLSNISDGLYGISLTNHNQTSNKFYFKKVIFELFNSQSQGGNLGPEEAIDLLRGRDNYFNHGQFVNGWAYQGIGLGSSFITAQNQIKASLPKNYINDKQLEYFTNNNRVLGFYGGLHFGYLKNFDNQIRYFFSKNLGTYQTPFESKIQQLSIMNTTTFLHDKSKLYYSLSLGLDSGKLLYNNFGIFLGIKKIFFR